jgi:hypothetical protein
MENIQGISPTDTNFQDLPQLLHGFDLEFRPHWFTCKHRNQSSELSNWSCILQFVCLVTVQFSSCCVGPGYMKASKLDVGNAKDHVHDSHVIGRMYCACTSTRTGEHFQYAVVSIRTADEVRRHNCAYHHRKVKFRASLLGTCTAVGGLSQLRNTCRKVCFACRTSRSVEYRKMLRAAQHKG